MACRIPLFAAATALALAGCSAEPDDPADSAPSVSASADPALTTPQARPVLLAEEVSGAALAGELSCSFAEPAADGPLLVAAADVDDGARADGVLKLGPSALRLRGAAAGGFNEMVRGARFTSGDLAVRVVVLSGTPLAGGESPPLPARLEIVSDAGTQRIDGEWSCGP